MITETDRPIVVCELEKYAPGHFEINGKMYRPTWPRAPKASDLELTKEMVNSGVTYANQICSEREVESIRRVRIERYENGTIRTLVICNLLNGNPLGN